MKSLRLTCPEDLIAAAPSLLGFHPDDSVVLIAAGLPSFQARVDLPPHDAASGAGPSGHAEVEEVVSLLLGPVERHAVAAVVLLYFCEEHARVVQVHGPLWRALRAIGVEVPEALHVRPTTYASLVAPGPRRWHEYDVSAHPLLAEAVFEGRQIQPDRPALAAEVARDHQGVAAVDGCLPRVRLAVPPAEVAWATETVEGLVASGEAAEDAVAARLVAALAIPEVRDAHWVDRSGAVAGAHARVWAGLLRRCPDRSLAAVASLTAMLRFRSGDGARAWCALDRAPDAARHPLGSLVTELLTHGVSPAEVDRCWAADERLA